MLITLAIIGVVAALTIPSIVQNYQKTQTVTQLKKIYSALSNTTNLAIAQEGPIIGWSVYSNDTTVPETSMKGSEHFAKTYVIPYLKVSKICGYSTNDICSYSAKWMNDKDLIQLRAGDYYKFILNDGTNVAVVSRNFMVNETAQYIRAEVYIDLNGPKKPNTYGKDIHALEYLLVYNNAVHGKFVPWGYAISVNSLINDTSDGCNKTTSGTTIYCTAAIIKNGWKIPDEYPW